MLGIIDNYNFKEMEAMKYYAPPSTWPSEKKKEVVKNRIFSNEWLAAEKKDGFFGKFIKDEDGNLLLYSRSRNVQGEFVNKIEWVPHLIEFFNQLPNGTCLLGELYLPSQPGSKCVQTILGCLKDKAIARQQQGEKINFYIFDILAYSNHSLVHMPAQERFEMITSKLNVLNCPYIQHAQYYRGITLWEQLQVILADDREGMVLVNQDAIYEPGKRPSKTTLKVKQELKQTIDCVVIGANEPTKWYTGKSPETWKLWINDITQERLEIGEHFKEYHTGAPIIPVTKNFYYCWAGSLKLGLVNNGKMEYYGDLSGLTEEVLGNWKQYLGKVCEVGGMMIDKESGHIRHPKFICWRDDKSPKDCTIDQL